MFLSCHARVSEWIHTLQLSEYHLNDIKMFSSCVSKGRLQESCLTVRKFQFIDIVVRRAYKSPMHRLKSLFFNSYHSSCFYRLMLLILPFVLLNLSKFHINMNSNQCICVYLIMFFLVWRIWMRRVQKTLTVRTHEQIRKGEGLTRTNESQQGDESKIGNFEKTYFLNSPLLLTIKIEKRNDSNNHYNFRINRKQINEKY